MTAARKASKSKHKAAKKPAAKKAGKKKVAKKKVATKKAAKKKVTKKKVTKKKVAKKKVAAKKTAAKKTATKKKATKKKATKKKASARKSANTSIAANKKPRRRSANARKPVILTVGDPAPAFELDADNGKTYSLIRLHGKRVVLYFYPRDNTPGCTAEACDFRDLHAQFKNANTVVLGISSDSVESHVKFSAKLKLPFPLLSDPGHKISTAYSAYGKKAGKSGREGFTRCTYIISPAGRVEAMYTAVRVKGHAKSVLEQATAA